MTLSLHAATVPGFIQMLGGLERVLGKACAHVAATGIAERTLVEARLIDDMLPFAYQVKSTWVHSLGAIRALEAGRFSPDTSTPPDTLAAMAAGTGETRAALAALDPAALDAFAGRTMTFVMGDHRRDYDAEQFLLSFSLPNFFFHVATAYDLLRMHGVAIGKVDYLGRLRSRPRA